jgi:hypothetical protein
MNDACPVCSASVTPRSERCDECQVALDWKAGAPRALHPFIRPGEPLLYFDLTRSPLPGKAELSGSLSDGSRYEATPNGSLLHVFPKRAVSCHDPFFRCRDACVRAAIVTHDPHVTVACLARVANIGDVRMMYDFEIEPHTRRVSLSRGFGGKEASQFAFLLPWTPCAFVAPVGAMNVIELRVQGPTLEARLNDQHVATIHDAVLGIGAAGFRAQCTAAATTPQRVTATWFEVRQVIA